MLSEQPLSKKLEQLSAAATQGEWFSVEIKGHAGWSQIGSTVDDHKEWPCGDAGDNDAPFIVALVNLYRTGQLVAVQADDVTVERVSAAICDTLKAQLERYAPEALEYLDLTPEYWTDVAKAAISALAAKGDA